jgi:hypothetical protein
LKIVEEELTGKSVISSKASHHSAETSQMALTSAMLERERKQLEKIEKKQAMEI